ncbi:hypothetical protein [Rothia amarae]|uniref:hypothetical protein n=1 Tax=Rothia amarae TaxID=169480 RepID=UPI00340AD069
MPSLSGVASQSSISLSSKSDIDLRAQQIARENYVKRPRNATPAWEESTLAKAAIIPAGYCSTLMSDTWLTIVHQTIESRRADHAHNTRKVCQALAQYLDHEKGIIRATWATLTKTAQVSRATLSRILRELKDNQLLGVIASGRSAEKSPRGQEQRNLAPVYTLLIPSPAASHPNTDEGSFYDENGNLFVTDTPSPLRDRKISYKQAITEGIFDSFCKQGYARYARTHKNSLEKKRQTLKAEYSSQRQRNQALAHLARTIQHHCFDLRGISASAILEVTTPFFEIGWSVRDVLYALDYSPVNQPYNTRGAAGMRSVKKWLELRMSQWMNHDEIMPSRTATEEQEYRQRQVQQAQQSDAPKKATGPSIEVKRRIKVALLGEKKARVQFPELF